MWRTGASATAPCRRDTTMQKDTRASAQLSVAVTKLVVATAITRQWLAVYRPLDVLSRLSPSSKAPISAP